MGYRLLAAMSVALAVLSNSGSATAQVNVQVIPAPNGCKGAIVYNNSSHVLEVKLSYIYEGRDGAHYSGDHMAGRIAPRSNQSTNWLYHGPIDCSKPYTIRTNYTYVDITAREQREQAEQQRQADLERRRREEYMREQQRRRDEADARRAQEREEWLRKRNAQHQKDYEAHLRRQQEMRNKPGFTNCPKGMIC